MYRELLSEGAYDSAAEYAQLLAFAETEFEEEVAKEEYEREYFNQIESQKREQGMSIEYESGYCEMTREEAIDVVKCLAWHARPDEEKIEQAIKTLEQDTVLDEIRAEMEKHRLKTESIDPYDLVGDCLDIIDKYKAEREEEGYDR